ncbi:hypothetical protein WMY93_021919 [Mugilogobius chulae]|uniref:Uncharacterized protein n=1 Tax=Mugilogobius chulae TaxID=88201 RepID=A0AAW0NGN0_9GOBI
MSLHEQEGTSQDHNPTTYKLKESAYIFREGMVPPHRQMFYQLCDLHVDRIQKVVNANNGQEKKCDERDGWCVVGTSDQLRDIVSDCIKKVFKAKKKMMKSRTKKQRIGLSTKLPQTNEEDSDDSDEQDEGLEENPAEDAGDEPAAGLDDTKEEEDEGEEEGEEFQPSEGSDNEMETEMLEYM